MKRRRIWRAGVTRAINAFLFLAALLGPQGTALGGPPFATDDPFPLPVHTGESYLFATGTHSAEDDNVDAGPGIEVNYSAFRNTFFHLVVPLVFTDPSGEASAYGLGDVELGFKWRFVEQSRLLPDIAVFPFLEVPTGDEDRGLGNGRSQVFLPLWLGKDFGPWTVYGGGGYWINPGEGNRNWWFSGMLVQRQISDEFYLGAELYHQTADTEEGAPGTGFNIGGGITVAAPYQILFSAGRNIQHPEDNRFSYYLAIYRTF